MTALDRKWCRCDSIHAVDDAQELNALCDRCGGKDAYHLDPSRPKTSAEHNRRKEDKLAEAVRLLIDFRSREPSDVRRRTIDAIIQLIVNENGPA